MPHLGITAGRRAGDVEADAFWRADRIAVGVETPYRQMPVVEIHAHDRPAHPDVSARCLGLGVEGFRRDSPTGGEITAGPTGFAGDRVGHRLSADDPRSPLLGPVGEHGLTGWHVAAAFGVGEVLQGFR
jgi:hypothetical protein